MNVIILKQLVAEGDVNIGEQIMNFFEFYI